MRWTDVSVQSPRQSGLLSPLLAAVASAAACALLKASPANTTLLISLIFAVMGLSVLALPGYKRLATTMCGALAGISSYLGFQLGTDEGNILGTLAMVYGAAIAAVLRLRGATLESSSATPLAEPQNGNEATCGGAAASTELREIAVHLRSFTPAAENETAALRSEQKTVHFMEEVIHQIRLPLNTIVGFAEILQSPAARDLTANERNAYPQVLLDCSRQLSSFVIDVADMLRIDANHFHLIEQEVDAAELIEIAMKSCRAAAEEADSTIIVNVIENVELRCDAARIRRVLVTLVTRAVRASRPGATVTLSFLPATNGGLRISVIDTGAVLPSEVIERAFEPSFDDGALDGLGLAIANKIARLHGGDLTVEPAPAGGMVSHFRLPPDRVSWNSSNTQEAA